jgi:steroid delta-isomerase-like uncharacterized protein
MAAKDTKELTRYAFDEVWNKGNFDVLDEIMSPDSEFHVPGWGDIRGPDDFREFASTTRAAFPDFRIEIEEQIAEGDRIATRWTWQGTHRGEFMGVAPTGQKVTVPGITMGRVSEDGRGDSWILADMLGLLHQLGAIPQELSRELSGARR